MPFDLKNVSATYELAMNAIFHDMINHFMEIYIDNIVGKSKTDDDRLVDLEKAFKRMGVHLTQSDPSKMHLRSIGLKLLGIPCS